MDYLHSDLTSNTMKWYTYGSKDSSTMEGIRQPKTKDNPNQPKPSLDIPGITSEVLWIFLV